MLKVDVDKITFIIAKSREFAVSGAVHDELDSDDFSINDIQDETSPEDLATLIGEENNAANSSGAS